MILEKVRKSKLPLTYFSFIFFTFIAILPLIIKGTYSLEVFHWQYFYFNIGIGILLVTYGLFFCKESGLLKITSIDAICFLLLFYIIIHSFINSVAKEYLLTCFNVGIVYFLSKILSSSLLKKYSLKDNIQVIFIPFLFIFFIETSISLLQSIFVLPSLSLYFRISGTFTNPAILCGYLLIFLPGIFIVLREKVYGSFQWNQLLWGMFIGGIIVIILSGNRSSIIALSVSVIFIFYRWRMINLKYIYIILACFLLLAIFLFFYKYDSAVGRIFIWRLCILYLSKYFVMGAGIESFPKLYNEIQRHYFSTNVSSPKEILQADFVSFPYNELLSVLIEIGFIGVLILIIIIIQVVKGNDYYNIVKKKSLIYICILSTTVAFLIYSMFSYPTKILEILTLISVGLGFISSLKKPVFQRVLANKLHLYIKRSVILLSICVLLLQIFVFYNYMLLYKADKLNTSDYPIVLSYYRKAMPYCSNDPVILYKYAHYLHDNHNYLEAVDELEQLVKVFPFPVVFELQGDNYVKLEEENKAQNAYLNSIYTVPKRFTSRYKLFLLYKKTGKKFLANEVATELMNIPVKVPSQTITFIQNEMKQYLEEVEK